MNNFISDLRYAARMLRKNPGFTFVAVVALALGIGANTAIFSVVNAVLLRPLPFPSAKLLMAIDSISNHGGGSASYPDFQDYRARNHSFRYIAAYHPDSWALTASGHQAVSLNVAIVSADLFPMLGIQPILGRTFRKDEDENIAGPMSVLISARTWRKQFAADPRIVGRPITLRGLPYTIAGVMPQSFNFPVRDREFDAWSTFGFSNDLRSADAIGKQRGAHFLELAGELKSGVTPEKANADLTVITTSLEKAYPDTNRARTVHVQPLLDRLVEKMRPSLLLLLAAVGCVLLVACANVANLLLARASSRHRELAIRAALGAGRLRVIRQVLTESVLLSLVGGGAGLLLGVWGNVLLTRFSPRDVPRVAESSFDATVFLFAIGASLLTGFVFGIVPALRASQSDPAEALKEGSRGSTEGIGRNKARSALIVGEVALALMLLACAGLLIRSLDRLNHFDPGFQPRNVLTAQLLFPEAQYNPARFSQTMDLLETRLRAIPGVVSVSDVGILPLRGDDMSTSLEIEGRPAPKTDLQSTRANIVAPGYLAALGIPLLAGRDVRITDTFPATRVVLINQAFARKFFPNENPIGKRIKPSISATGEKTDPLRVIIGVTGSIAQDRIGQKSLPEVYLPRDQVPFNFATLVIKTRANARGALPSVEAAMRGVDPNIPLDEVHTLDELVSRSLAQPGFQSFLLVIFAAVALILTAVGLYGVIAYSVAQRTHEIGTRMALGAQQNNILKLVVGQGMMLTLAGVGIGIIGALAIGRFLESLLFEVAPTDPLTLAFVALVVFAVALLASFIPALRAANVDPMVALRYE